jgi:tRNA (guanine37-N1)-methyltransferase
MAALVLVDAVTRLVPGVLGNAASAIEDSFSDGATLDHPCYTRPRVFRDREVPAALVAGDHAGVAAWRAQLRAEATRRRS